MPHICGIVASCGRHAEVTEERVRGMARWGRPGEQSAAEIWTGTGVGLYQQRRTGPGRRGAPAAGGRYRWVCDGELSSHSSRSSERDGGEAPDLAVDRLLTTLLGTAGSARPGLPGPFALAVWEEQERRLTLVRDRLGGRPLFYIHAHDGSLFFASEIRGLLAAAGVRPALNLAAVPGYLALGAPADDATMFEGVRRVPPGHAVVWQDGHIRVERRAAVAFSKADPGIATSELSDRYALLFRDAVRRRLTPDLVPGAVLSGCIGCAAMVSVLGELSGRGLRTYSIGIEGEDGGGQEWDRRMARAVESDHHEVVLAPDQFLAALPAAVWNRGEPLADPAGLWHQHAVAAAAGQVNVAFSAAGSDELLAADGRSARIVAVARLARAYEAMPLPTLKRGARWTADSLARHSRLVRRLAHRLPRGGADARALYLDALSVFRLHWHHEFLTDEARERGAGAGAFEPVWPLLDGTGASDPWDHLLAVDLGVRLPEVITTQDLLARGAPFINYLPFLDDALVDLVASLPPRFRVRGRNSANLLRLTAGSQLPDDLLRPGRPGGGAPIGRWLRGAFRPLLHEFVLSDRALRRGILRPDAVGQMVAEHESGRADHARQLWVLLNLEIWQRLFVDAEAVAFQAPRAAVAV
jgi:asparagine synthase (glutamine-hydrolysing)